MAFMILFFLLLCVRDFKQTNNKTFFFKGQLEHLKPSQYHTNSQETPYCHPPTYSMSSQFSRFQWVPRFWWGRGCLTLKSSPLLGQRGSSISERGLLATTREDLESLSCARTQSKWAIPITSVSFLGFLGLGWAFPRTLSISHQQCAPSFTGQLSSTTESTKCRPWGPAQRPLRKLAWTSKSIPFLLASMSLL